MKVAEIKKEIEAAYNSLKKISRDKESREIYESKLKGIRDWVSSMDENFQEGEQIGIKKGRAEGEQIGIKKGEQIGIKKGEQIGIKKGKIEGITEGEKSKAISIAKSLIKTNLSAEEIAKHTGLSVEEIKNLKGFNKKYR